jgi:hypothetical protein
LLNHNIIAGDTLNFINPVTKAPIIFSEWIMHGDIVKRKDYVFKFLVEQSQQTTLFNEENNYSAVHFLKLADYYGI